MTPQELMNEFGRARLGIDGNCGYALLGENIQTGECEFVEAKMPNPSPGHLLWCAKQALEKLCLRLELPTLSWYVRNDFRDAGFEPRCT